MEGSLLINFILAAIAVAFFVQLLIQKKHFKVGIEACEDHLESEVEKYKKLELQYQSEINSLKSTKQQNSQPDNSVLTPTTLLEIENLRKEKESELKLRLEAEKQVELALQKNDEMQKKIEDWKILQETSLKDATNTITKVGDDLYEKLAEHQKNETDLMMEKMGEAINNVNSHLEKINQQIQSASTKSVDTPKIDNIPAKVENDTVITNQKLLEDILKSAHLQLNTDYFMKYNLPESAKKSVPCEALIVLSPESAIIVDIKSSKFFAELALGMVQNIVDAKTAFKQKIDRYLAYLTNPKYQSNIVNYFSKNGIISPDIDHVIIMLVPTQSEIDEFHKLGDNYLKVLDDNHILLHSLSSFEKIISG